MRQESQPISPIRLRYGVDDFQFGDLYLPDDAGSHPVVILIHGGYWRARYGLDLMDGLAQSLAQRNIAAWNIEYRRVGNPDGGWPGTFLDVAIAANHLREVGSQHQLDLARVVMVGHSAGGHLAFWLAAQSRIPPESLIAPRQPLLALTGAVSLAGVLDLHLAYHLHLSNDAVVGLLGATPDEKPERYAVASPAALLPLDVPQVVIHGDMDNSVPLEVSQRYVAAARAAGDSVEYIEPKGVDHFDVIDPSSAIWAQTVEVIRGMLAR